MFSEALAKIEIFCQKEHIQIFAGPDVRKATADWYYIEIPSKNFDIPTICHELAHVLLLKRNNNGPEFFPRNDPYGEWSLLWAKSVIRTGDKSTFVKFRNAVIRNEKKAWQEGKVLAINLGIASPDLLLDFCQEEEKCVDTYRKGITVRRRRDFDHAPRWIFV